jgi:hypothetical protein
MSHVRYLWLFAYSGVQHILHDHIVSLKGQIKYYSATAVYIGFHFTGFS